MKHLKEHETQCSGCNTIYDKTTWSKCPTCRLVNPYVDELFQKALVKMPAKRVIHETLSGKPLNPLAQTVQDMCCGTTCDKQPIVQRIDELESQVKGLQQDLDGIDDLNATFDERVEKKCKLAFRKGIDSVQILNMTPHEHRRDWLQFKAEQGL